MTLKSEEFRKAAGKVFTIAGMNFIQDDYKQALKMAAKALDTMAELEKLNEMSGDTKQ